MIIDHIIVSSEMVLQRHSLTYCILISVFDLTFITWFAIICYKWEIDDRRKHLIEFGIPQ